MEEVLIAVQGEEDGSSSGGGNGKGDDAGARQEVACAGGQQVGTRRQKPLRVGSTVATEAIGGSGGSRPHMPVHLAVRHLTYSVMVGVDEDRVKKEILKDVSFQARPGEFVAVLGPSGSGKTTLMNVLSARARIPGSSQGGDILLNGHPRTKRMKKVIGYVTQDDIMFPNLTVRETMMVTAFLRLRGSMPKEEKTQIVDTVIEEMNLSKVKGSMVGSPFVRGVSGGERRRVNIGNEMLTNPSLMLLDEPTSGLDSSTAMSVLRTLRGLAAMGRTVVCTIHQPNSIMYGMFDHVILLGDGCVVYNGRADGAMDYFSSIGFPCNKFYNPADYMLELLMDEELIEGSECKKDRLIESYKETRQAEVNQEIEETLAKMDPNAPIRGMTRLSSATEKVVSDEESRWETTWMQQFSTLLKRAYIQRRGDLITRLYIGQIIIMALIVGVLWFDIQKNEASIQDALGYTFFLVTFFSFYPLFSSLTTFPPERAVIAKERASGAYRLSAYYLSKLASDTPLELSYPSMFLCISWFMTGINNDWGVFFAFFGILLISANVASSVGLLFSSLIGDFKKSVVLASIYTLGSMLISGFFVQNIPEWISWLKYAAFITYTYRAQARVAFLDVTYQCATPSEFAFCPSRPIEGTDILNQMDLDMDLELALGILIVHLAIYRYLTYMVLRWKLK